MFEINAMFERKVSDFEKKPCVVEKVVKLSGAEYDHFAHNMLRDQDFIRENKDLMRPSADGKLHCLLVVGEGRPDGILIDSSGYDYARYSALIPNIADALPIMQYPVLGELNRRLTDIVEHIAEQIGDVPFNERAVIDLQDLETQFGIDLMTNGVLRGAVLDMLNETPGIREFELDKNELIFYREPESPDRPQVPDRERRNDKPSVTEQIKAAREAPRHLSDKAAPKKDKGGPEL